MFPCGWRGRWALKRLTVSVEPNSSKSADGLERHVVCSELVNRITKLQRRHRVVIVGAGFGGLAAAKALRSLAVEVVLVDERNHHTFQPLLYQVATAGLDADDVTYATRGIFHRQRNATVVIGSVTGVDFDERLVDLDDGRRLAYDHLILAPGAVTHTFGVPGVAEHAFGLKSVRDAVEIRSHVLACVERADGDPLRIEDGLLNIVVVGGGPTGVELAGGLAELFSRVLRRDFPGIDLRQARIVLVEATDRVLRTFDPKLSRRATRSLERLGVEVVLGTAVREVAADHIDLGDAGRIPCRTTIWAAGVTPAPLVERLGLERGPGGRIVVGPDLTVPGRSEVFAIGDAAASLAADGAVLPQVAPVAIQGARHVAAVVEAHLRAEAPPPFRYVDKGSMATIGRLSAVAELPGGRRLSGPPGWIAWLALHLVMLVGFRNRLNVLTNWAWNYLTYDRASRIVIDPPGEVLRNRGEERRR